MWLPELELCLTHRLRSIVFLQPFLQLSSREFSLVFRISMLSHCSVLPYHCFLSFFHSLILSLLMVSFCHVEVFWTSQEHLSHLFFLLFPASQFSSHPQGLSNSAWSRVEVWIFVLTPWEGCTTQSTVLLDTSPFQKDHSSIFSFSFCIYKVVSVVWRRFSWQSWKCRSSP